MASEIDGEKTKLSRRSLLPLLAGMIAIPAGLAAAAPEGAEARERKAAPFVDQPPVRGKRGHVNRWRRRRQRKGVD